MVNGYSFNVNDKNPYGVKMSINEILFVQVQYVNNSPIFVIQLGPYNQSGSAIPCRISTRNLTDHYISSVKTIPNGNDFIFAGEMINEQNRIFIGQGIFDRNSSTCENSFRFLLKYIDEYDHQEYHFIAVQETGRYVYGFTNEFIYIYNYEMHSILNIVNGNVTWPHPSFIPHGVDVTDHFGVIVGFILNPLNTAAVYIPIIYLINFNRSNGHVLIMDVYMPKNATFNTWQDRLTNSDANVYSSKYEISVDINEKGMVLVGMQFINRVFLFSVNKSRPIQLNYISRNTNGRSLGNGKSVAWLNNGIAAILVNSYSLDYQWSLSSIHFYDIEKDGYTSSTIPLSTYPNSHQLFPSRFSLMLVHIVSSPSSLALMDNQGNVLIFNPTSAGYYSFIEDIGSHLLLTSSRRCPPGTYKNQSGIHYCHLCPNGSKNPGHAYLQCLPCLPNSFCPLGAVSDIPIAFLNNRSSIFPYPKSPESIMFDDILIRFVFFIRNNRCFIISPSFWTLIVASLVIIIIVIMAILKICIVHPRGKSIRKELKSIFRHIDLINEGQLWVGGLASIAVLVLLGFAFSFSSLFLQQYPAEKISALRLACDSSLINAKFETSLQSLSIQRTNSQQKIFELLNNQNFSLNVDFINTLIDCSAVSLQALHGTTWNVIRWDTCFNHNSILSLSIPLPYQQISVQILIADTQTVGGLKIGLSGDGSESEHNQLRQLNFHQSLFKMGQTLAPNVPVILDLTKVVNETYPMIGEDIDYKGIYVPTFNIDRNSLFLSASQYIRSTSTSMKFQIDIRETPYYVQNVQQPIARSSEIVFQNLLFTIVCLGIFRLAFLLYKLIIRPTGHLLFPQYFNKNGNNKDNSYKEKDDHDIKVFYC